MSFAKQDNKRSLEFLPCLNTTSGCTRNKMELKIAKTMIIKK